jgi:hypothetical protein
MTRFVLAISKAIAAVKFAPFRNRERAIATAAYEHDELAAPSADAARRLRGLSSPMSRVTVSRRTTVSTTPESRNPRTRAQRIRHPINEATSSAWPSGRSTVTTQHQVAEDAGPPTGERILGAGGPLGNQANRHTRAPRDGRGNRALEQSVKEAAIAYAHDSQIDRRALSSLGRDRLLGKRRPES